MMSRAVAIAVGRRILNPLELLLHFRPVFVESIGHAGLGRGDDVGPGEHIEPAPARQIANVDPVRAWGLEHVDIPVIHAAMDRDIAHVPLGGRGRVFARNVHDSQNRPGGMPVLPESGPGPRQGRAGELPVGVQPVRVARQDDDPIFLASVVQCLCGCGRCGRRLAACTPPGGRRGFLRACAAAAASASSSYAARTAADRELDNARIN